MKKTLFLACALISSSAAIFGQGGQPAPSPAAKNGAPIDLTGYWVSQIVDEWRFRVTPVKGDIRYLPLNADARGVAELWDPAKDEAEGKQCKAYGAVGIVQRPGLVHITWADDNTLKMEFDTGTQTRFVHFKPDPQGDLSWQGYSAGLWQASGGVMTSFGGFAAAPAQGGRRTGTGTLMIKTTNMLPGYLRKNGVPYSDKAALTEWITVIMGADGTLYLIDTASLEDSVYLTGPFIRTYTFKKQNDGSGWDPTACLPR